MEEFITDDQIAQRLREARDEMQIMSRRATAVAERLNATALQLGPEPDRDAAPEVVAAPRRTMRHTQDRLPL